MKKMIPSEAQLRRLADAVVTGLLKGDHLELVGREQDLRDRFFAVLRDNFAEETKLESDAEAFADSHRREMAGMDRNKVVDLVKQRLAKERGFVL
jgi:hypothetical protein